LFCTHKPFNADNCQSTINNYSFKENKTVIAGLIYLINVQAADGKP